LQNPNGRSLNEPSITPGIATADKLETRLSSFTSSDGVPDEKTAQKVYDNLDFQRAVRAYLNSIRIASIYGMRNLKHCIYHRQIP
jgi:hypothetical protein